MILFLLDFYPWLFYDLLLFMNVFFILWNLIIHGFIHLVLKFYRFFVLNLRIYLFDFDFIIYECILYAFLWFYLILSMIIL